MSGTRAFIGLGSNIQAERNLPAAVRLLGETPGIVLAAASPVYRTPPWGEPDQPDFLNAVLEVRTHHTARTLLEHLLGIEQRLRRVRTRRWGPRTVDLDLLFYDEAVIREPDLEVPHPRLHQRAFVLIPLCDLAPQLRHPVLSATMLDLLDGVERAGIERTSVALPLP